MRGGILATGGVPNRLSAGVPAPEWAAMLALGGGCSMPSVCRGLPMDIGTGGLSDMMCQRVVCCSWVSRVRIMVVVLSMREAFPVYSSIHGSVAVQAVSGGGAWSHPAHDPSRIDFSLCFIVLRRSRPSQNHLCLSHLLYLVTRVASYFPAVGWHPSSTPHINARLHPSDPLSLSADATCVG